MNVSIRVDFSPELYLLIPSFFHYTYTCIVPCKCCRSVTQLCLTLCDSWTAAHQAFFSFTVSQSLLKLTSIESVMPSNHLIFCHSLLLLPSVFPSIRDFSNELALSIRWPKYWGFFSFTISSSSEIQGWFPFGVTVWPPCCPRDSQQSSPAPEFKGISFDAQPFLWSVNSHICAWLLEKP